MLRIMFQPYWFEVRAARVAGATWGIRRDSADARDRGARPGAPTLQANTTRPTVICFTCISNVIAVKIPLLNGWINSRIVFFLSMLISCFFLFSFFLIFEFSCKCYTLGRCPMVMEITFVVWFHFLSLFLILNISSFCKHYQTFSLIFYSWVVVTQK